MTPNDLPDLSSSFDAVVIGGGPAGLSAATALGRALRSVLVVDSGEPRNAPADGVHNVLGHDGTPPTELLRRGRAEAEAYGVRFVDGMAEAARAEGPGFVVDVSTSAGGRASVSARKLVVTTGLVDVLPDVPGLREHWGGAVLHCPYCHGWEVRGRTLAVLATGPMAAHQASLFRQWTDALTLVIPTNDGPGFAPVEPTEAELEAYAARGIRVLRGTVERVAEAPDGRLAGLVVDGVEQAFDAIVVAPRFVARSVVLEGLGLAAVEHPLGVGTFVESGPMGETGVRGVWLAGNVTDPMAQVAVAAGAGLMTGARVNAELVEEETAAAVAAWRARAAG